MRRMRGWARTFSCAAALLFLALPLRAADLRFVGSFGLELHGGDFAAIDPPDYTQASTSGGSYIRAGFELTNDDEKKFGTQMTLGYKTSYVPYVSEIASIPSRAFGADHEARFERYPVELLELYEFKKDWRLGGGITYHVSPRLYCVEYETGGCATSYSVHYHNALGSVVQLEVLAGTGFFFAMRYTFIRYRNGGNGVSGDGAGFLLGFRVQ